MGNSIVTPPEEEPVTLDEAKAHLHEESNDNDALIAALIVAARQMVEKSTRRSLVTQTRAADFWGFPGGSTFSALLTGHRAERHNGLNALQLPYGPVSAVTSVEYIDDAGVEQTLAADQYVTDLNRDIPRLYAAPYISWPVCLSQPGAVTVTYTAGYGAADDVEQGLKQLILLIIGHWYQNREAVVVESATPSELPMAAQALINLYQIPSLS